MFIPHIIEYKRLKISLDFLGKIKSIATTLRTQNVHQNNKGNSSDVLMTFTTAILPKNQPV